jgi:predicted alpha/beta hydrolase family esterase
MLVVLRVSRVPFTRVVARRVRASSRDDHVCRMTSARYNKLFSFINTHVSNVNSSGHIF